MINENDFAVIEQCFSSADAEALAGNLQHPNWRVQFAAALAVEGLAEPGFVPLLLQMARRDNAEIAAHAHSQTDPALASPGELEARRRRGRLKQAICLALRVMGPGSPETFDLLEGYVADTKEDYSVRTAASKALASVGARRSIPALTICATNDEFCSRVEAQKAIAAIEQGDNAELSSG